MLLQLTVPLLLTLSGLWPLWPCHGQEQEQVEPGLTMTYTRLQILPTSRKVPFNATVDKFNEHRVDFELTGKQLRHRSLRIETSSSYNASEHEGDGHRWLFVSVRYSGGEVSWQHNNGMKKIAKTICVDVHDTESDHHISVHLSSSETSSSLHSHTVPFRLDVIQINNFLPTGVAKGAFISPNSPYVWQYHPHEEGDKEFKEVTGHDVMVEVRSAQEELREICALVAVQPLRCPFHDSESDVQFHSRWQTMLTRATIHLKIEGEYADGFYVVALTRANCTTTGGVAAGPGKSKWIQALVRRNPLEDSLLPGVLAVLIGDILLCGLAILVSIWFAVPLEGKLVSRVKRVAARRKKRVSRAAAEVAAAEAAEAAQGATPRRSVEEGSAASGSVNEGSDVIQADEDEVDGAVEQVAATVSKMIFTQAKMLKINCSEVDFAVERCTLEAKEMVPEREVIFTATQTTTRGLVDTYKHHLKSQTETLRERRCQKDELTLDDLAATMDRDLFPAVVKLKSSLYVWIIFLMGLFYTLPVLQLLFEYQNRSLVSGNLDQCYYNYLCKVSIPGVLEDFGHVFSNVAYLIAGGSFVAMCKIRQERYKQFLKMRRQHPNGALLTQCGIPEQYGIFYAMGGALFMEGILSACYHICPTQVNFQFDTTFMYAIAILVFLKVFQFRHPDITSNAYNVFAVIGAALSFEVLGYYFNTPLFWLMFVVTYIVLVCAFAVHTYYNGTFTTFRSFWSTTLQTKRELKQLRPNRKAKFLVLFFVVAFNLGLAVFFSLHRRQGVSNYLLIILIANMNVYVVYYCCMKLYYRWRLGRRSESINLTAFLYFLSCIASAGVGCAFFAAAQKDSNVTPAESRALNAPCVVYFYDNHDLWHFFSAAGLFFLFMMILTLEDDNLDTPWENIPVF